uniref:Uncharacterized protein n=1 Tax=Anguilla anguilla TaxID=7936 RepID=A0A0E9S5M5_ANGAN
MRNWLTFQLVQFCNLNYDITTDPSEHLFYTNEMTWQNVLCGKSATSRSLTGLLQENVVNLSRQW